MLVLGGQVLGSKDSFRAGDPGATALNTKAALDIGTQRVGRRVGTRVGGSGGVPLEVLRDQASFLSLLPWPEH